MGGPIKIHLVNMVINDHFYCTAAKMETGVTAIHVCCQSRQNNKCDFQVNNLKYGLLYIFQILTSLLDNISTLN